MRYVRIVGLPLVLICGLVACGSDSSSSGVAIPGAPRDNDVVIAASTSSPVIITDNVASSSTTVAATTTVPAPLTVPTTIDSPVTSAAAPTTIVEPTTTPPIASSTTSPPTTQLTYVAEPAEGGLSAGVEGPRSLQLQRDLIELDFLPPGADDGQYGPGTAGGVRRFQESAGLVLDGVAGPITLAAIQTAIAAPPTTTA